MKSIEEVGKGLIALANLTLVLIFFKEFSLTQNWIELGTGIIFSILLYSVGYTLIKKTEKDLL